MSYIFLSCSAARSPPTLDVKPLNTVKRCTENQRFAQNSVHFVTIYIKMNLQLRTCGEKSFTLALQLTNTGICFKNLAYLTFRYLMYQKNWFILIMIQFFMNFLMKLFIWSTRALIMNIHYCRIKFYRECMKLSLGKAEELRLPEGFWAVTEPQLKTPGMLQKCLTLFLLHVFAFNIL